LTELPELLSVSVLYEVRMPNNIRGSEMSPVVKHPDAPTNLRLLSVSPFRLQTVSMSGEWGGTTDHADSTVQGALVDPGAQTCCLKYFFQR